VDKFLAAIVAVVLLIGGGCKRESAARPAVIQVATNAQEVAAARQAWSEQRERRLSDLLKDPEAIRSYDPESLELIRSQSDRSIAALTLLRDNTSAPPETRLQAACALKHLGVVTAPERLAEFGRANATAGRALLFAVQGDDLWKQEDPLPGSIRQFVVETLAGPDTGLRHSAAQLASWRKIDEAADPLVALVQKQAEPDMQLLKAAARLRPSAELLQQLEPQLKRAGGLGGNGALGAIADLGEAAADPGLKKSAATACAGFLKRQPDQPWIDGDAGAAVVLIASLKPPESAVALLADVVRSGKWRIVREMALGDVKKLDPAAAKVLAGETGVKLHNDANKRPGDTKPARTMEELAAICVHHGLLTRAEADSAIAKSEQPSAEKGGIAETVGAEALFSAAGRFLTFDVETGMSPNRHDLLLREFAQASAGKFRLEAPLEDYQESQAYAKGGRRAKPDQGRYRVQFVHQDRLYKFEPNDLGDWYDVVAVVSAIHRALGDAGAEERFIALESGGQDAGFIFAKPGQLAAAAAELGLTLGTDMDQARKTGKEFEEKALKELQK